MSNLEWFENELKQLGGENEPIQQQVNQNILNVVKVFNEGGHSGFSAGYAIVHNLKRKADSQQEFDIKLKKRIEVAQHIVPLILQG